MKRTATFVVAAFAATVLSSTPVHTQSTFGAVVGVIADVSQGVLPDARVTLMEVQTGVSRNSTSRENGAYEFLNLTQGLYRIEVSLTGFTTYATEPFPVEARQTVRINAVLQLIGFAETLVVDNVRPRINTETPTISDRVSHRELQELPFTFRTRNTSPIPAIQVIPEVQRVNNQFSLSGSLPYQNEVSVDGILTTNIRYNGVTLDNFPSIEAIEEIKVSSVNNTAEFAQLGDITTISRPGTNAFHGTAFWNFNTTGLNANPNYFNKARVPEHSDNHNMGASLGGPLARNRTFFFGTFERLDITRTQSASATVPSAALRSGDFSALATPIIDPATGQPFPGNAIPASRVNPVAARLLESFIPPPNEGTSTHRYTMDGFQLSNQFDIRIDQNFNQGHTLFGRLSGKQMDTVSPAPYQSLGPRTDENPIRTLALADNYALSPSLLNEARFGFSSADSRRVTGVRGRDMVSSLGLRLFSSNLPDVTGTPSVNISGFSNLGEGQEAPLTQDMWQFTNNLTWVQNTHTVKGGFDVKRFNWAQPVLFTNYDEFGIFRFNNNIQGGGTGHPFANFLLGLPTEVDQTSSVADTDASTSHYGVFIQDDWRVNRSVTVSAGVRYDVHVPLKDCQGNITNFLRDTANGDVVVPDDASRALTSPGFAASIGSGRILTADEAGLPGSLRRTDFNNVSPRLGIAWRPDGDTKTVVRAGYGLYSARILGSIFYSLTAAHTSDNMTFSNRFDPATRTYSIVWPNTFAGDASRGAARVGTQNFSSANDPNYKDPQTQQWSLTFERELERTNAVRVSYSGFRSTDLTMAPDLNQLRPNTIGFVNLPLEARPYPNWNRVNTRDNGGYHHYHDILVQLRGDLPSLGLSHVSSYKWAHSIDNIEDRGGGQEAFQIEENVRTDNRFEPDYMRGKTTNIPDHRFVSALIWNLPVGRGRAFASDISAALDAVAGGWTLSSVVQIQSGGHLTAYYSSHCGSGTNCFGNEKADAVSGQDPNDGPRTLSQWFNTAAFSDRAFFSNGRPIFAGRFGDAEKGSIIGPTAWNVDFAAFKDVGLAGDATFRLSVVATNLFNHANWGRPDTNLTSPNYGRITTLNSQFPLRTIVIGARVTY